MNTRIVKATVNGVDVWRVYHNQELIASFPIESTAISFAIYLENKTNENTSGKTA
jgi:hypothetical protein